MPAPWCWFAYHNPYAIPGLVLILSLVVIAFRLMRRHLLLSRLPRLQAGKLTLEGLTAAAHARWPAGLVRLPGQHGVLVTDPQLARALLERGDGAVCREVEQYERYAGFLGGALVLLPQTSVEHRVLRSALLPLFTSAATRRSHGTLVACTERLIARMAQAAAKRGSALPIYRLVQEYTLDVTCRVFFGQELEDRDARRLVALFEEWLEAPPPSPPPSGPLRRAAAALGRLWRTVRRADSPRGEQRLVRVYEGILDQICARMALLESTGPPAEPADADAARAPPARRAAPTTVLGALGSLGPLAGVEARRQAAGLLFAGLNSASELRAMLVLLSRHPTLQERLRSEVDELLGAGPAGRPPRYDEIAEGATRYDEISAGAARCKDTSKGAAAEAQAPPLAPPDHPRRLDACARLVHEALRLSPGIEHLRLRTTRTVHVEAAATAHAPGPDGVAARRSVLPGGTRLVVSPAALHRHPDHWPQPCDAPRPELFTPAARAARVPGCFLPFSAGAKGCPAAGFALHESRMLLAMVVQRFELYVAEGGEGVCLTTRA